MAGGIEDGKYTYDLLAIDGGPRRPNLRDLGGDEMEDEDPAPKKFEQPTAAWANGANRTLAGLARLVGPAEVWVEFVSGAPQIVNASAMGTAVTTSTFTPTLVGTGEFSFEWPANTLPPMERQPLSYLNSGPGTIYARKDTVNPNKILVFMTNPSGVSTNFNFAVQVK
jgi:hypothetical protein